MCTISRFTIGFQSVAVDYLSTAYGFVSGLVLLKTPCGKNQVLMLFIFICVVFNMLYIA